MLTTALAPSGCSSPTEKPQKPSPLKPPPSKVEFTPASFDDLYPLFLLRKLKPGPKAALWQRYYGKWVRWTGTVVSFSQNGITLKQLPQTVTFDVSLWIEADQRTSLRERIRPGDRVEYIGRLDSYDDVFRTLYLVHGEILGDLSRADAGPPDARPDLGH